MIRLLMWLALLWPTLALAHTRSESFSSWTSDGAVVNGIYQVDALRATQLATRDDQSDLGQLLAARLAQSVQVTQAGARCAAQHPQSLGALPGQLRTALRFACPRPLAQTPAHVDIGVFAGISASHVHYARVAGAGGAVAEQVLANGATGIDIGGAAVAAPSNFVAFARLGLLHVMSGADHIAFLLALALLAGTPWRAVAAATGFTLGHSLTLALVALGALKPDTSAIEALIGFTVAYAAFEAMAARAGVSWRASLAAALLVLALPLLALLLGRSAPPWSIYAGAALFMACAPGAGLSGSARAAPLLALAFGLIHGAGFAGPLVEMALPRDRLLMAVLGFNLGVEAAQLLVLGALALVAIGLRRSPVAYRTWGFAASIAALAAVGSFWFVSRSLI